MPLLSIMILHCLIHIGVMFLVSETAFDIRQEREMVDLFRLLDTDGEGELPGCSCWWFLLSIHLGFLLGSWASFML